MVICFVLRAFGTHEPKLYLGQFWDFSQMCVQGVFERWPKSVPRASGAGEPDLYSGHVLAT